MATDQFDETEEIIDERTGRKFIRNKRTGQTMDVGGRKTVEPGVRGQQFQSELGAMDKELEGGEKTFEDYMNAEPAQPAHPMDEYIDPDKVMGDEIVGEPPEEMEFTVEETDDPVKPGESRETVRKAKVRGYPTEAIELADQAGKRHAAETWATEGQFIDEQNRAFVEYNQRMKAYEADLGRMEERWGQINEEAKLMARQAVNPNRLWNDLGNYNKAAVLMGAIANGILKVRTGQGGGNDVIDTLMKRIEMDNANQATNIKLEREALGMQADVLQQEEEVLANEYAATSAKFQTLVDMAKRKRNSLLNGSKAQYNVDMAVAKMMERWMEFEERNKVAQQRIAAMRARSAGREKKEKYINPAEPTGYEVKALKSNTNSPSGLAYEWQDTGWILKMQLPGDDQELPVAFITDEKWYAATGTNKRQLNDFLAGLGMFQTAIELLEAAEDGKCDSVVGRATQFLPSGKMITGEDCFEKAKSYMNLVLASERHALFGAALTPQELESWNAIYNIARKNLTLKDAVGRAKTAKAMLRSKMNGWKAGLQGIRWSDEENSYVSDPSSPPVDFENWYKNPAYQKSGHLDRRSAAAGMKVKTSKKRKRPKPKSDGEETTTAKTDDKKPSSKQVRVFNSSSKNLEGQSLATLTQWYDTLKVSPEKEHVERSKQILKVMEKLKKRKK